MTTDLRYIAVRIHACPVRGEVRVVESMPADLLTTHRTIEALLMERPDATFVGEMLTDADLAEFLA